MKQPALAFKVKHRLIKNYGQWAVVTGATSGIGLELTTLLAESGFNLIINARNIDRLLDLQSELQNKHSIIIKVVAGDIGTDEGINAIINSANGLNIGLFIAAAGFGTSGRLIDSNIQDEVTLMRVNCEAVLRLSYFFGKLFSTQKRGGIILLSSMVAFQGVPFSANYSASKAYVQSLAEALSIELKTFNVNVLAAAPGPVESGFGKRANMKMNMTLQPSDVGVPILKALGRKNTVLPGSLTKFLMYSLKILPRWGKVKVMGKVMSGFTKHQATV